MSEEDSWLKHDQDGDDGFRRRNSLERYRPGAYFNEEREKLRRRAHFGERRLTNESEDRGPGGQQGQKSNGYRRRGRGGNGAGRGHRRNGGQGGGESHRNGGGGGHHQGDSYRNGGGGHHQGDSYRNGAADFNSYRDGTKHDHEEKVDFHEYEAPPPPIGNWADDLSDDGASPDLVSISA